MHTVVTSIFTIAGLLIVPFVLIYTSGIHDANYQQPLFAILLLLAYAMYSIRLPYQTMILAAGHYKQTQNISFTEAGLNVFISLIGVQVWGLCGVALGTLVAMTYCNFAIGRYLEKDILHHPFKHMLKHYIIDILSSICIIVGTSWLKYSVSSYMEWVCMATKITLLAILIVIVINSIFYRKELQSVFIKLYGMGKKLVKGKC